MYLQRAHSGAVLAIGILLTTLAAISVNSLGLLPDTPISRAFACILLLVFGLPHGSFDLALIRGESEGNAGTGSRIAIVGLYIGCAALVYLAWRVGPVLALAVFLLTAVVHFAEDWEACGSSLFAGGIAVAIVSAPSLFHASELRDLFISLTGSAGAADIANFMRFVAPIALAAAMIGVGLLWRAGKGGLAISASCALAATLLLPPVPGFALFFCLVHSPIQFKQHAKNLGWRAKKQWLNAVVPMSLGGFGIATVIFLLSGRVSISANVFASSFMALSVLTVPHMLVPLAAVLTRKHD